MADPTTIFIQGLALDFTSPFEFSTSYVPGAAAGYFITPNITYQWTGSNLTYSQEFILPSGGLLNSLSLRKSDFTPLWSINTNYTIKPSDATLDPYDMFFAVIDNSDVDWIGTNLDDKFYWFSKTNSINTTFDGRSGSDSFIFGFNASSYLFSKYDLSNSSITVTSTRSLLGNVSATLTSIENFVFTDKTLSFTEVGRLVVITPPTINITSSNSNLSAGQTPLIQFTLSENSNTFTLSDVSVSSGTLSNFTGSGSSYSALYTPPVNSASTAVISVGSNTFSDNAGDFNATSTSITLNVNTVITPPPIQVTITGTSNNDLLVNLSGNNQINGGEGIDTLVVSGLPSQYKFSGSTLTGVDGVDTLTSIESIRFGSSLGKDLFVSDLMPSQLVDPDGNGPRLSPVNELIKSFSVLYIAYFNRSPDIEGLMYWFKELNSGNQSLSQVSAGFTKSPEYSKAYPAGSSNREFITQIYKNLFDRAPDTEGLNFWENTLNAGSPRDVFINTVINGAYAPTGGASDRALLDNKHAVSLHYTEKLSSFPTEAFDMGISTVLNRVTSNPATVNQGLAVIDHVMDNPITLTGLINDTQAFNAYWGA